MADKLAKEELKIIRWLRFMRCMDLAMKQLFTVKQWKDIEDQAKFKTLAIDSETNTTVCIEDMRQSIVDNEELIKTMS